MVTFKYLEGLSEPELMHEARRRLERSAVVVANRNEDTQGAEQTAWPVSRRGQGRVSGREAIAAALGDLLEAELSATP